MFRGREVTEEIYLLKFSAGQKDYSIAGGL